MIASAKTLERKRAVGGAFPAALRTPALATGIGRLLLTLIFILVWEACAWFVDQPDKLPAPSLVALATVPLVTSGELPFNAFMSLQRVLLGFGMAAVVGVSIGLCTALSARTSRLLYPLLELLRPIPAIAMVPVFLVLLGIGESLSVGIVFFAAVFPIIVNTHAGIREVPALYREAARTLGAGKWRLISEVVVPAGLPMIFTGLRLGLQFGWMSIVGAEFIGATNGLGYMIVFYQRFLMTDRIVVGMFAVGILGFFLDRILLTVRKQMVPWIQQ